MLSVLIVAAEQFELEHIQPRSGWNLMKVANGPGPKLAREAAETVRERVDVVVSTGLCGGLHPVLRVGDIFVATEVNGRTASLPRRGKPFRSGPLVSIDRIAQTAEEKRELRIDTGAMAVEMEAEAVAAYASRIGVPFYCIRAVSDVAEESFMVDLNAARLTTGRFSVPRILLQAARRPLTVAPELLRLRRNAGLAARALGEFFADCDF